MSTEIQPQLEDIKSRVADLEKAEIKLRIQSVGPRGPIGPAGPQGLKGEVGPQGIRGEQGRDGRDGKDGKNGTNGKDGTNGRTPSREELESIVVQLLQEYHVLNADALPYSGPYAKN